MPWCDRCKEYAIHLDTHECPPTWSVWCEELGGTEDDAKKIQARDTEEAAKRWARDHDSGGDYEIVGGAEYVVCVREDGLDEKVSKFTVRGETVPAYYADACD